MWFWSEQFKTASILNTEYPDHFFDAVAVRAALDHLCVNEFNRALDELKRISKENGLLFHYYSDEDIQKVFQGYEILDMETDGRGNQHLVVKSN
ncbi:MAG: class I SAM-dependent methyltransferase [Lachnospiraceae bacterium]|nr:class I SAM-dependent methyltransferase [Lachnospiraceae bacterium]